MVSFAEFVKDKRFYEAGAYAVYVPDLRVWVEEQIAQLKIDLKDASDAQAECIIENDIKGKDVWVNEFRETKGRIKFCEEMLEGLR
jgi:hypothetical protein